MSELKDYIDFCNEQSDCYMCPLCGDEVVGIYDCCMGFVSNYPEKAEEVITTWKENIRQRQIANQQTFYIVYDTALQNIEAIATTQEKAEEIVDKLAQVALDTCLAVDPEDSGLDWDNWTEEYQRQFYETQIKSSFIIIEKKIDTYKINGEVELV